MKNAFWIYMAMGVLTIVPLILYNIPKIWVRRPPDPVRFKVGRCIVISVICLLIGTFLTAAYHTTMLTRYEMAVERVATRHAEMLTGRIGREDFRAYLVENGGEEVGAAFDQVMGDPAAAGFTDAGVTDQVRFQFTEWCVPKYWQGVESFPQVEVLDEETPAYIRYVIEYGELSKSFTLRMRFTAEGWRFDYIGVTNDGQESVMKLVSGGNGKWFTVQNGK